MAGTCIGDYKRVSEGNSFEEMPLAFLLESGFFWKADSSGWRGLQLFPNTAQLSIDDNHSADACLRRMRASASFLR